MKYPEAIVLIRHGQSIGNVLDAKGKARLNISTKDYGLTPFGKKQCRKVSESLPVKFKIFDAVYTSYCKRTKETAEIIFGGNRIIEDARLGEAQRGIWHTMSEREINQNFPFEERRKKHEGLYYYRPLGGENWPDVEVRIHSFIETLCREHAGQKVALVVHGHWLVLFQKIIHGLSIEEALEKYESNVAENASMTIYRGGDDIKIVADNVVLWKEDFNLLQNFNLSSNFV